MYFLTNYCLFMGKVENNNIIIWKISIVILYISHFLFFTTKFFTKNNDFWHIVQGIRAKFLQNLKQIGIKLNLVWLEA